LHVDERLEISGMRLIADVMNRSNAINMTAGSILATKIVIHDITFDNFSFGIMNGTNGNAIGFGVVYNCTFNNNRVTTRNSGFVNTAALKGVIIPSPAWGTNYYMVYEDNVINFTNWYGGPQGANYLGDTEYPMNYIVRHCTMNVNRAAGQAIGVDGYDMHGNYGTYLNGFGFIIHDNVWNYSGGTSVGVKLADIRGGVGSLIFNNTIYGQSGNYIALRADPAGSVYPRQTYTWNNRSNTTAITDPGSVGPPVGYTEVAYPHPLRSSGGAPPITTTTPEPPTALKVSSVL
jgi:hypothetical protein